MPLESVTVNTLVVIPTGKEPPETIPDVKTVIGVVEHKSVPTGAVYDTLAAQVPFAALAVIFAGHVILGNCTSLTVTVKLQVAELFEASVTLKTLVVVPTGNEAPDGSPEVCIVAAPVHKSVPTGAVYVTVAAQVPKTALTVIFAGQLMVGSCASRTVTEKLQVAVFPEASVTLKVFVVTPKGNVDPEANPDVWIVVAPEHKSVPIGAV